MQEFKIWHDLIAVFDLDNKSTFNVNLISKNILRSINNSKYLKHIQYIEFKIRLKFIKPDWFKFIEIMYKRNNKKICI